MLTPEQVAHFDTFGFLPLQQLLSRAEVATIKRDSIEIFDEMRVGRPFDGKKR